MIKDLESELQKGISNHERFQNKTNQIYLERSIDELASFDKNPLPSLNDIPTQEILKMTIQETNKEILVMKKDNHKSLNKLLKNKEQFSSYINQLETMQKSIQL